MFFSHVKQAQQVSNQSLSKAGSHWRCGTNGRKVDRIAVVWKQRLCMFSFLLLFIAPVSGIFED